MSQEIKSSLFGGAFDRNLERQLMVTSFSEEDYLSRKGTYDLVCQNYEQIFAEAQRAGKKTESNQFVFAEGMGNSNLRGTTLMNASISTLVTSIVPYFSIERPMDHIQASLGYYDFYGVVNGEGDHNNILDPNIGLKKAQNQGTRTIEDTVAGAKTQYSFTFGEPLFPSSIVIVAGDIRIADDGRGSLLAAPGILKTGKVDYATGKVEFEFNSAPSTEKIKCSVNTDYTAKEKTDRIRGEVKYYNARAGMINVDIERNIIQDASVQKMNIVGDVNKLYAKVMVDQYHVKRNTLLARTIQNGYLGNTMEIDLSNFSLVSSEYPAYINSFMNMLEDMDQHIHNRLGVVSGATAYLVGKDVKYAFSTLSASKNWVPNDKATYVVGLVGWWKGRPVVYSDVLEKDEAYASCKTIDGTIAPIMSGPFLPLANLPTVGDYNNPSNFTTGVYSMEALGMLTSSLLQKFTVKIPEGMRVQIK